LTNTNQELSNDDLLDMIAMNDKEIARRQSLNEKFRGILRERNGTPEVAPARKTRVSKGKRNQKTKRVSRGAKPNGKPVKADGRSKRVSIVQLMKEPVKKLLKQNPNEKFDSAKVVNAMQLIINEGKLPSSKNLLWNVQHTMKELYGDGEIGGDTRSLPYLFWYKK